MRNPVMEHKTSGVKLSFQTDCDTAESITADICDVLKDSGVSIASLQDWKTKLFDLWPQKA